MKNLVENARSEKLWKFTGK